MTPRQQAALDFINIHWLTHEQGPRYVDIAEALGMSTKSKSGVHALIYRLRDQGLVTLTPGRKQSIRPTGRCPCCGR